MTGVAPSVAPGAIFITGGGSGLGAAVARHQHGLGRRVALCGRNAARLQRTAETLSSTTDRISLYPLDVRDAGKIEQAVADFQPDALVCAAGMLGRGQVLEDLTPALFSDVMATNVGGMFHACRAAMRLWSRSDAGGDIVNISSLAGIRGQQKFTGFAAYATSKHAVVGLTEALALEGKASSIRVNAVAPGSVRTAMTEALGIELRTEPQAIAPIVDFLLDRTCSGATTGTTLEVHCNDD
jgi:NAD(P)-dependent dehydrogenase (short-subunit alcohol dehydrogenase family)